MSTIEACADLYTHANGWVILIVVVSAAFLSLRGRQRQLKTLTDDQVDSLLDSFENKLFSQERKSISLTKKWAEEFSEDAGVYAVFEDDEIVYVGETGKLTGRFADLLDTRNHALRRNVGKQRFHSAPGYKDASVRDKFPTHIETLVENRIKNNMKVSVLTLKLGRLELEEWLIEKHDPRYNLKRKRK